MKGHFVVTLLWNLFYFLQWVLVFPFFVQFERLFFVQIEVPLSKNISKTRDPLLFIPHVH